MKHALTRLAGNAGTTPNAPAAGSDVPAADDEATAAGATAADRPTHSKPLLPHCC